MENNFIWPNNSLVPNLKLTIDNVDYYPLLFKQSFINSLASYLDTSLYSNIGYSRLSWLNSSQIKRSGKLLAYCADLGRHRWASSNEIMNEIPNIRYSDFSYHFNQEFSLGYTRIKGNIGVLKLIQGHLFLETMGSKILLGIYALTYPYIKQLFTAYVTQGIYKDTVEDFNLFMFNLSCSGKTMLSLVQTEALYKATVPLKHRSVIYSNFYNNSPLNVLNSALRAKGIQGSNDVQFGVDKYYMLRHGLTFLHTPAFNNLSREDREFALLYNPLPIEVSVDTLKSAFLSTTDVKTRKLEEIMTNANLELDDAEAYMSKLAKATVVSKYSLKPKEEKPGEVGAKSFENPVDVITDDVFVDEVVFGDSYTA